jgi:hypothetical protein
MWQYIHQLTNEYTGLTEEHKSFVLVPYFSVLARPTVPTSKLQSIALHFETPPP